MLEQFLQAEVQNLGWVHLPQLAEQHQKPGKSQTVRVTASFWNDLVRTQAANQVYEVTAQLARLLISWGVFCHH